MLISSLLLALLLVLLALLPVLLALLLVLLVPLVVLVALLFDVEVLDRDRRDLCFAYAPKASRRGGGRQ